MRFTVLIGLGGLQEAQGAAFPHVLGAQVRCHDKHRITEIHHVTLAIRHATIIQDLQQGIPDFGMGLFNFVEQQHPVRAAADGLG